MTHKKVQIIMKKNYIIFKKDIWYIHIIRVFWLMCANYENCVFLNFLVCQNLYPEFINIIYPIITCLQFLLFSDQTKRASIKTIVHEVLFHKNKHADHHLKDRYFIQNGLFWSDKLKPFESFLNGMYWMNYANDKKILF